MSEACTNDCSSCQKSCSERKNPGDFRAAPHPLSRIGRVIGVVSGKGGVGKSMVTSLLAVLTRRAGYKTAILDADITGPSIPTAFGLKTRAENSDLGLFPLKSKTGIDIMSLNLLLENRTDPVVWRGPVISGAVKQFWTDVVWGEQDFMFIDMPPGTGDVSLTVFQSLPLDGVIIVTSPQELVSMIVEKAVKMAAIMNIPVLALVENMSYFKCPGCSEVFRPFGQSRLEELSKKHNIEKTASLPIEPGLAAACDGGIIELFEGEWLDGITNMIIELAEKK